MTTLAEMLRSGGVTLNEVTEHIEDLPHKWRLAQTLELGKKEQSKLWDIAKGGKPLDLDYLVPPDTPPLVPFPFEGKNSLPMFTRFQKVFYLQPDGTMAGYNNQKMAWATGPGYYVVGKEEARPEEILVDYTRLPWIQPAGWPKIRDNMAGLSRFVYGGTKDYLRWVSTDVVIGRATRAGQNMPNWFILCRHKPREEIFRK